MRAPHGLRTLTVAVLTSDEDFARAVTGVCLERGHDVLRLESLSTLSAALSGSRSSVLLLDSVTRQSEGLRIAATVSAVHPDLPIVVATPGPRSRSKVGVRLIDRRERVETIVDEVELAYIGIPAFVEEPLRRVAPIGLAGTR
jgi:hypothetical protein